MNQENKQTGSRYPLFEHMVDEYGLHLLDSQIDDITLIAAEINGIKSLREELEKLRAELTTLKVDTTYDITNLTIEKEQLKAENERLKKYFSDLQSAAKDMKEYLYRGDR